MTGWMLLEVTGWQGDNGDLVLKIPVCLSFNMPNAVFPRLARMSTPVSTVSTAADALAAEQQKIRQMMPSFGKGGSVAPNVRL